MKNFLLLTLLILAALVGCKKQPEMGSNLLTITAVKSDFDTKATETAFEVNDKIGLYVNENVANLPYETLDGISWQCRGFLNEFLAGKEYFATAYYPFSADATNPAAMAVGGGIDFMISAKTKLDISGNAASGTLQFKHVLSKLVVSIDTPEEIDGVKTVSLDSIIVKNVFRKATININTGAISNLSDKSDTVVKNNEVILIPQTVSRIEFVFKMASGGFSKLAYIKELTLESGKKTTLNARSNADLYFASYLNLMSGEAQSNLPLSIFVATGRKWTLKSSETWLTFSKTSGIGKGLETITASVKVNSAYPLKPRAVVLTLADDKPSKTSAKTMQNCTRIPTVEIAGTNWLTANLTGTSGQAGTSVNISICPNPQDYGMFFKWGDRWIYGRASSSTDGQWTSATSGASTSPASSGTGDIGYDYTNLSGGRASGDPCQLLGASYKTPTIKKWQDLVATGKSARTYQGINGYFFGTKASTCNNTTIQTGCIFISAAGYRSALDGSMLSTNTVGAYWSSSARIPTSSYFLRFEDEIGLEQNRAGSRGAGLSVRCVAE